MDLKFDTIVIKNVGIDLETEAKELTKLFEKLYSKLYSIQKEGIWLGYASDHFLSNISGDLEKMQSICNTIDVIGKNLITLATKEHNLVKEYRGKL